MDETYPGHVVVLEDAQRGADGRFIAVCVDRQHGLFLRALDEQPFHPWYVTLTEDWMRNNLYIETNILHQPESFAITQHLGTLSEASKKDIADAAYRSDALVDEQKEIISDRMLGELDFSYFAKGEAPHDVPWE